ncbi:hypothetical protein AHU44_23440 [Salmonella enterica subsp. diarizonae]|nr:hypothetical protein [Salmonella enterica subsp. diarizonae]
MSDIKFRSVSRNVAIASIAISIMFLLLLHSAKSFAKPGLTYSQASGNTRGVFRECKLNEWCKIKAPTYVRPATRNCIPMSSVPPLIRSLRAAAEGRSLGIEVSGNITIYPPPSLAPVTLGVGQSYTTYNEWGACSVINEWPINNIFVKFTRAISKSDLPVRILAFGRGRDSYISGFQNAGMGWKSAANIVIDGSLIDDSPDVIEPSCTVAGSATIKHGKHTPTTIVGNIASSLPVSLKCNGNVSVSVDIKGNRQIYGQGANWTTCGSGACEIKLNGGNKFTVNGGKHLVFTSTWHSLGQPIEIGKFTGSAVATFKYN